MKFEAGDKVTVVATLDRLTDTSVGIGRSDAEDILHHPDGTVETISERIRDDELLYGVRFYNSDGQKGSFWYLAEQDLELTDQVGNTTHVSGGLPADPCPDNLPDKKYGHPEFYKLLDKMAELHSRKNHDYAGTKDPLRNLKSSTRIGLEPFMGVLVRLQDKWSRLESFAQSGELLVKDESVEDTLMDNAVYSLLCIILMRESKAGGNEKKTSS